MDFDQETPLVSREIPIESSEERKLRVKDKRNKQGRPAAPYSQTARVLELNKFLRGRVHPVSIFQIAHQFNTCQRTARRDLHVLRDLGEVELINVAEKQGTYAIPVNNTTKERMEFAQQIVEYYAKEMNHPVLLVAAKWLAGQEAPRSEISEALNTTVFLKEAEKITHGLRAEVAKNMKRVKT